MLLKFTDCNGKDIFVNSQSIHAIEEDYNTHNELYTKITYSSGMACFVLETKESMADIHKKVNEVHA